MAKKPRKRSEVVQVEKKVSSVLTGYQIPIIKSKIKPLPILGLNPITSDPREGAD